MTARYVLGMDLSTTNSVVPCALGAEKLAIELLPIPQLVDSGTIESLSSLPSFLYLGREEEAAPVRSIWRGPPGRRSASASLHGAQAAEVRTARWERRKAGSATAGSTATNRCCRGTPRRRPQGLAGDGIAAISRTPRRRMERPSRRAGGRAAGRAHGAGVVRRVRARIDARGRPGRRLPQGLRPHRRAAGGGLRLVGGHRRALAQQSSAWETSSWFATWEASRT